MRGGDKMQIEFTIRLIDTQSGYQYQKVSNWMLHMTLWNRFMYLRIVWKAQIRSLSYTDAVMDYFKLSFKNRGYH